ncbi:S53 family peptidase [Acidicapsa dinghuensis]|uniref:S53 family peptidase n=1 Tax=Acidicapsa dinghuensis TaxID=2218256 RepID=A0ABW1EN36_9BACT|nr:S53 family peptidase [Acidicapsa dinghuensis]
MEKKSCFHRWLILASACIFTSLLFGPNALAQQRLMTRHTREVVTKRQVPLVRALPATRRLKLAIMLPLRNQTELNDLLRNLNDPQSPQYHRYLSVQQFTDEFGPTQADLNAAVQFTQANGMTVTRTTSNRMVIDVWASVASIEKAFHVKMGVYQHPTENRTFYAPDREPTTDSSVRLWHIAGLDDFSPPRPMLRFAKDNVHTDQTGSGPNGQYLGSDMRAAYYGGTALTGAGQSIGIFGLNFNLSDVENYYSSIGQPFNSGTVITESIDGYDTSCGSCNDGEPVADIVQSLSMAPGANAVIEYEASNDVDTFTQMATENVAKQLSASVGWLPADPASDEPIFMEFAAQGQNLFVASGDSGAYSLPGCTGNCNPVFYPADDPYITAVGGTHITTNGSGGSWQSEISWGGTNPVLACANPTGGSSGGYSTNGFSLPAYQQLPGAVNSTNQASKTLRNIPDIAAEADCDNWWCAGGTCQGGIGGTSLSTPRWAGFMALVNEQAANKNAPPVGFLNPTVYGIGTSASYDSQFHDISSGSNDNGLGQEYFAVTGYDLVTGWGSPNGQTLINMLTPASTAPYFALSATPSTLTVAPGATGATGTIQLTSGNGFNGTVNLTANILGAPSGVTATLSPTAISGSQSSILTVSLTGSGPGGDLVLVVTGTSADGVATQPAYVKLALPTFSLSASPSAIYINQDGTANATLSVAGQNGFDGKVTFSPVTGLPSGVSALLHRDKSASTSTLELAARATTPTGPAVPLTLTGTSGDIVQSASSVTLTVSAGIGTNGSGRPIDLSSAYNLNAIYKDGTTITTGGLDGGGSAYSANVLTRDRVLNGVQFHFGPSDKPDAVGTTGQTINTPAGNFSTLQLLGTGFDGNQAAQAITVTYMDGTTAEFTQSFSDWFSPSFNTNESFAVVMPYRNLADGTKDNRPFNLYGYVFVLDSHKAVKSFTLPDDPNVVVLAATLTTTSLKDQARLDLSRKFNLAGVYSNGVTFPATGGMDGGGDGCTLPDGCADAYSSQQLGLSTNTIPSLTEKGIQFEFGPVNTVDCTTACLLNEIDLGASPGTTVHIPFDKQQPYETMTLLGTGANGSHTGTVTVHYVNGPSETFNQTFSDWCSYGANANESVAVGGIERINSDGTLSGASCNLYAYTYALDPHRKIESVTLTNTDQTSDSFVLAITLQPGDERRGWQLR